MSAPRRRSAWACTALAGLVGAAAPAAAQSPAAAPGREPAGPRVFAIALNGDSPLHMATSVVAQPDGRVATDARGRPLERRVYTPAHHLEVALQAALRAGSRFGVVIDYDPLGSSGVTTRQTSPRSARTIVIREGRIVADERVRERDSSRGSLRRLLERAHTHFGPRARIDLVYFGKSLVRPYDAQATDAAEVAVDASHPQAVLRLPHFARELDAARAARPGQFPLESVIFLACQMSSAEVLAELSGLTRRVLAPQLEISHLAWFGSLRFLDRLADAPGAPDSDAVMRAALAANQENGRRNLELAARGWEEPRALQRRRARRRRPSAWMWLELEPARAWLHELRLTVDYVHDRYVRPGRFAELHRLLERARVRSRWPRTLVSGVDLGQLLVELSYEPDRPDSVLLAQGLQAAMIRGLEERPGLRGIAATAQVRHVDEYAALRFARRTGWHERLVAPYQRWLATAHPQDALSEAATPTAERRDADRRLRALRQGAPAWDALLRDPQLAELGRAHRAALAAQGISPAAPADLSLREAEQRLRAYLLEVFATPRPDADYPAALLSGLAAFRAWALARGHQPTRVADLALELSDSLWRARHRLQAPRYLPVAIRSRPTRLLVLQDLRNHFPAVAADWAEAAGPVGCAHAHAELVLPLRRPRGSGRELLEPAGLVAGAPLPERAPGR